MSSNEKDMFKHRLDNESSSVVLTTLEPEEDGKLEFAWLISLAHSSA
jgi:hypothetical protein